MKVILLTAILVFATAAVSQRATAGPLDALKNFFVRRQSSITSSIPFIMLSLSLNPAVLAGPGGSPSPLVSPGPQPQDPQPGPSPGPSVLNNGNIQRPMIDPAPLY